MSTKGKNVTNSLWMVASELCTICTKLGAVHKLRLQEEGGRWSKNRIFVNIYTIENVNGGGRWSKKAKSCKRSL